MKQAISTFFKALKINIHRHLVRRFTSEQSMSHQHAKLVLSIHYVACAILFIADNPVFMQFKSMIDYVIPSVLIVGSIYTALLTAATIIQLTMPRSQQSFTSMIYKASAHLTLWFVFVIHPLQLWEYSGILAAVIKGSKSVDIIMFVFVTVAVVLGQIIAIGDIITRNNVPSKYPLAVVGRLRGLANYEARLLVLFTRSLVPLITIPEVIWGFTISLSLLLLYLSLSSLFIRRIWNPDLNWIGGFGFLSSVIIKFTANFITQGSMATLTIALLIVITMVYKLTTNIYYRCLKVDIYDKKLSSISKVVAGLDMFTYLSRDLANAIDPQDKEIYAFYMGFWRRHKTAKWIEGSVTSALNTVNKTELVDLISRLFNGKGVQDANLITGLLFIRLTARYPNYEDLKRLLSRLKSVASKGGFLTNFDLYHYRKLYENKLELSQLRIYAKADQNSDLCELSDIYSHMPLLSGHDRRSASSLAIDTALHSIAHSKEAAATIDVMLDYNCKIFRSLMSERSVSGSNLYECNRSCKNLNSLMNMRYKDIFLKAEKNPPSYLYALYIYYFSCVRPVYEYEITLLKEYKNKLNMVANLRSIRTASLHSKSKLNIDWNKVAIQSDLSSSSLGNIKQISLNYFEFIGHTKEGRPEDYNIHDLIPRKLASRHRGLMKQCNLVQAAAQHRQLVHLVGFDGCLRTATVQIRLSLSKDQSLSAVILLTFDIKYQTMQVLADRNMQIIAADKCFWKLIDSMPTKTPFNNINQLSSSIEAGVLLLHKYSQLNKSSSTTAYGTDNQQNRYASILMNCLSDLDSLNSSFGVQYAVDRYSEYYNIIKDNKIVVQSICSEIMGISVIELQFRMSRTINIITNKSISKKGVASHSDEERIEIQSSKQIVDNNFKTHDIPVSVRSQAKLDNYDMNIATLAEVMQPVSAVVSQWKELEVEQASSIATCGIYAGKVEKEVDPLIYEIFNLLAMKARMEEGREGKLEEIENVNISPMADGEMELKRKEIRKGTRKTSLLRNCIGSVISLKNEYKAELRGIIEGRSPLVDRVRLENSMLYIGEEQIAILNQKERIKYSEIQQRMAKSKKVVIASSNSIAKILNKVMVDMN